MSIRICDTILEASIGYASAAAVAVMDEVVFVNERQDERMEGIEEGALSLVQRVIVSGGGELSVEGGSAGSGGADSLGWGEDSRSGEVSGDVEDFDQQSGGDCWIGPERRGVDSSLIC